MMNPPADAEVDHDAADRLTGVVRVYPVGDVAGGAGREAPRAATNAAGADKVVDLAGVDVSNASAGTTVTDPPRP